MDLSTTLTVIAGAVYLFGIIIFFAFHFLEWRAEVKEVFASVKKKEPVYLERHLLFVRNEVDFKIFKKLSFRKIWLPTFVWPLFLIIFFAHGKGETTDSS